METPRTMNTPLFHGIAAALVTPFTAEGAVDVDAVPKIVDFLLERGVAGLYVCGSTGEGLGQTVAQRKTMTEAAVRAVRRRVPVMVMVAAHAVEDAIELAVHAQAAGADAISAVAPPAHPGSLAAAVGYWRAIAAASALPFYVYWIAATADRTVTPKKFVEAMADLPTFHGIKFTDTDFFRFQQLLALGVPNCITGPDEMMVAGLAMGSHGAIGSTYNVHPTAAVAAYTAFRANSVEVATKQQWEMNRTIAALLEHCNCAERGTNIIAGLKLVMREVFGLPVGQHCTSLVTPLTQEKQTALLEALKSCKLG